MTIRWWQWMLYTTPGFWLWTRWRWLTGRCVHTSARYVWFPLGATEGEPRELVRERCLICGASDLPTRGAA